MPKFAYAAIDTAGAPVEGVTKADTIGAARAIMGVPNVFPTKIEERRGMLGQHGRSGSTFPQVQANTVASFALGDYEWILALEADDPIDLVDLMRHLRQTDARRHVREEIPFFTGRLITLDEVSEVLA